MKGKQINNVNHTHKTATDTSNINNPKYVNIHVRQHTTKINNQLR